MNRHRQFFLLLNIVFNLIMILYVSNSYGQGLEPSIKKKPLIAIEETEKGYLNSIITEFFVVYRQFISPVIGDRCRMSPSCSSYSHQALIKYGFLKGSLLTFDRLLHERDEYKVSFVVFGQKNINDKSKKLLTHDPLDNNVFWWKSINIKEESYENW